MNVILVKPQYHFTIVDSLIRFAYGLVAVGVCVVYVWNKCCKS